MSPAELVEEIARRIEAAGRDPHLNLAWMYPEEAAALVRSFVDDFTESETDEDLREAKPIVHAMWDGYPLGGRGGRIA